jgi:uncharacterized membrane protein YfcA
VALPFAAAMIVFSPLGAWLNIQLPVKPLLAFFARASATFTAAAAVLMLSGWRPERGEMSPRGQTTLGLTTGRMRSKAVKRVFGAVLLGVAGLIIVKDVVLG